MKHRAAIWRWGIRPLAIGLLTTIVIAWTAMRPWSTEFLARNQRGIAVVEGRLVTVNIGLDLARRFENWSVRDLNGGGYDIDSIKKQAARIREVGGAAYDAETVRFMEELSRELDPAPPQLPTFVRIDDLAERGPCKAIADNEIPELGLTLRSEESGWPFLALRASSRWHVVYVPPASSGQVPSFTGVFDSEDAWTLPWSWPGAPSMFGAPPPKIRLPMRPLWMGFIADTVIFAGAWSFILVCPALLRRASRRQRGRCPECAYDLKYEWLSGCPECGWNRGTTPSVSAN